MENKKVYEYLTVKEWFGNLDKGTRLHYDFDKNGYIYHYEYSNNEITTRYNSIDYRSTDYFVSLEVAENQIRMEQLIPGPELGEFQPKIIE